MLGHKLRRLLSWIFFFLKALQLPGIFVSGYQAESAPGEKENSYVFTVTSPGKRCFTVSFHSQRQVVAHPSSTLRPHCRIKPVGVVQALRLRPTATSGFQKFFCGVLPPQDIVWSLVLLPRQPHWEKVGISSACNVWETPHTKAAVGYECVFHTNLLVHTPPVILNFFCVLVFDGHGRFYGAVDFHHQCSRGSRIRGSK